MSDKSQAKIKSLAKLAADERTPIHEREAAALALAKLVDKNGVAEPAPAGPSVDVLRIAAEVAQLRSRLQQAEFRASFAELEHARRRADHEVTRQALEATRVELGDVKRERDRARDALRVAAEAHATSTPMPQPGDMVDASPMGMHWDPLTASHNEPSKRVSGWDRAFEPRADRLVSFPRGVAIVSMDREHRRGRRRHMYGEPIPGFYSSVLEDADELRVTFIGSAEDLSDVAARLHSVLGPSGR